MELLVQKYLRSGKTLADLEKDHGIYANCVNGKIGLNYDMIEAKNSDPVAAECRGLVLRDGSYDIVAFGMMRFFNLEQVDVVAQIDWTTARYTCKVDGTCAIVYYDNVMNKWCIGTRGRAEADADAHGSGFTFSQLVDYTVEIMIKNANPRKEIIFDYHVPVTLQDLMVNANKEYTYVFELTTPLNRILCKYNDYNMTLLAVRNNVTFEEYVAADHIATFAHAGVKSPREYSFSSVRDMMDTISKFDPTDPEGEGVVVVDAKFNRAKCKNPAYLAASHLKESASNSFRGCMEIILLGKDDDVQSLICDLIKDRIAKLKNAFANILFNVALDYASIENIDNMKDFAEKAKTKIWPAYMFARKRNKAKDVMDFLRGKTGDEHGGFSNASLDMVIDLCVKNDPEVAKLMKKYELSTKTG